MIAKRLWVQHVGAAGARAACALFLLFVTTCLFWLVCLMHCGGRTMPAGVQTSCLYGYGSVALTVCRSSGDILRGEALEYSSRWNYMDTA